MHRLSCILIAVLLALFSPACGKKADPGLPVSRAPEAPRRFQVVPRAEGIVLLWRAPDSNQDNTPLLDLAGFVIERADMPLDRACRTCPREYRDMFDYAYTGQRGSVPEKRLFYYTDTALSFKHLYTYRVRCYNERDQAGTPTKPLDVAWDVPPAAPADLRVERSNRLLRLFWSVPATLADGSPRAGLAGYTVYRTTNRGVYDDAPLNSDPVADSAFEDVPPELNTTYFYTVRALRRVADTLIESLPAPEIEVAYLDLQPPGVPEGLTAVPTAGGVLLKWIPKSERDFAGVNLYRSTRRDGTFVKLNTEPITAASWTDATARQGTRYIYAVTAVDRSPQANESPMSEPVEVLYSLK